MSTLTQKLTFADFLEQSSDDGIYELVNGELVRLEPTRAHKNVSRYLVRCFDREIERLGLDYIVDKDIVVRTITSTGEERGRKPDVSVISATLWNSNVLTYGAVTEPVQLAVEVVSTNWEDDYVDKLDEYQRLGIPEYWIVDYLAIGAREYLGNPKVPAVFIYHLIDRQYQVRRFRGSEQIVSVTFSELKLTAEQIINASRFC